MQPEASPAVHPLRAASVDEVAEAVLEGFDRHYRLFRAATVRAKEYFENAAWADAQRDVRDRIEFYDERVAECVERLRAELGAGAFSLEDWKEVKVAYVALLLEHLQPELAETFFNSVTTRLFSAGYSDNAVMFVRAAMSTEYVDSDPPIFRSYYPAGGDLAPTFREIFLDFGWNRGFADLERDLGRLLRALYERCGAEWQHLEPNHQVQVLSCAFYRNKAAYVVGKVINGFRDVPFVVPVLNDGEALSLDAILLEEAQLDILFSLSRAYCMVDMEVPAGYVKFLRRMMPTKTRFELYTMLGLGKQGKTLFHRDLLQHLRHSRDRFVRAPGVRGEGDARLHAPVVPVRLQSDQGRVRAGKGERPRDRRGEVRDGKAGRPRRADGRHARVHEPRAPAGALLARGARPAGRGGALDRRGRRALRDPALLRGAAHGPAQHLPRPGRPAELEAAVRDYGNAIRELAVANIFPGDMLWRNFGVTRHGRVVFYDYDEIEYLTDVQLPADPRGPEPRGGARRGAVVRGRPQRRVPRGVRVVPPADPRLAAAFRKHHAELLEPEFWQDCQRRIEAGEVVDFFPYPQSLRFGNLTAR